MWRKFTVYGLRFSKTSFWNRINTGFLDPAVATVLTACGIETLFDKGVFNYCAYALVATVLTACGIETRRILAVFKSCFVVATVLTACGIETFSQEKDLLLNVSCCNSAYRLRY